VAVQSEAMRVFELTLLDRVFEFYPDEEAAVASFSQ
jgi:anti-anti-sigma regulatory factor